MFQARLALERWKFEEGAKTIQAGFPEGGSLALSRFTLKIATQMRLDLGNRMFIPRNGLLNVSICVDEVARQAWNAHVFVMSVNVVAPRIEDDLRLIAEGVNLCKAFIRLGDIIAKHTADLEGKAEVLHCPLDTPPAVPTLDEIICELHCVESPCGSDDLFSDELQCFARVAVSCQPWEDEDEEEASGLGLEEPPGVQEDHSP